MNLKEIFSALERQINGCHQEISKSENLPEKFKIANLSQNIFVLIYLYLDSALSIRNISPWVSIRVSIFFSDD